MIWPKIEVWLLFLTNLADESLGVDGVAEIKHDADEFEGEDHEDPVGEGVQFMYLEHM